MTRQAVIPATSEFRSTELHDVLRNERRQHVIEILRKSGEPLSAKALADRIATAETGESPPPDNIRQSVYVALHQTHLPKLDDLEIVAYDAQESTVALLDRGEEVGVYMETVSGYGIAWSEYYLGVSLLGLLLIIAGEVGVPVLAAVGSLPLAAATFLLIVGSAAYQTTTQRSSILHRL